LHELKPTGWRLMIDGSPCLECLANRWSGGGSRYVWLAPDRDWLICRETMTASNADETKLDIHYEPDPEVQWTPMSWELTHTNGNQLNYTYRFQIESYTLNAAIPNQEFVPRIPAGVLTFDDTVSGLREGVMLPDGRFQPKDGSAAYYLPGEAGPLSRWRAWFQYSLIALIAAVGLILFVRLVSRRRGHRAIPIA